MWAKIGGNTYASVLVPWLSRLCDGGTAAELWVLASPAPARERREATQSWRLFLVFVKATALVRSTDASSLFIFSLLSAVKNLSQDPRC